MRRIAAVAAALLPLAATAAGPGTDKFTLESAEVKPNARISSAQVYNGFDCDGRNVSPSLRWKDAPPGTKSFAITVYDPDAPTGSGWWHWVAFNIPASVTSLPAGAGNPASGKLPKGAVQSVTDFGEPGYGGPCPPRGGRPHRYVFTVHALSVEKLDLDEKAMPAMVGFMVSSHRLARATFTATFSRR
jgi:Raf kinase inhibitor-like YbhB/YbcL family protein